PLPDTSRLCEFFPRTAAHAWNGRAGLHRKASATRRRLGCSRESLRTDSKLLPTDSARKQFVRGMRPRAQRNAAVALLVNRARPYTWAFLRSAPNGRRKPTNRKSTSSQRKAASISGGRFHCCELGDSSPFRQDGRPATREAQGQPPVAPKAGWS